MAGCESFEIAIEMARYGALGEAERTALERHLSGCVSCRAFEERARRTEGTMADATGEALRQVDWARVEQGIRRRLAGRLVRLAVDAVLCAATVAVLALMEAPGARMAAAREVAPVVALIWLASAARSSWQASRLARLPTAGDVLAHERRSVTRKIAVLARTRWLVLAVAALEAARAAGSADAGVRVLATRWIVAALLAGFFVFLTWGRLPWLRRELSDLDAPAR